MDDLRKRKDLARRARVGALFHPVLFGLVVACTPVWRDMTNVSAAVLAVTIAIGVFARLVVCARVETTAGRAWTRAFWSTSLLVAAAWGLFVTAAVLRYGVGPPSLILCLVTAGLCAGALSSFVADHRLARAYNTIVILPSALALTLDGPAGQGMAISMLLYLAFGLEQARQNEAALRSAWATEDDLRRTAESLNEAHGRASEAAGAKTSFIANMSHEIRTPLAGILGHAQLLMSSAIASEQRENVEALLSSGEHLLALLNDILDMSKIEAGQLRLELRPTDLVRVVREVTSSIRPLAARKGLAFALEISEALPAGLALDSLRVGQVLRNLLGNALKFTERGSIALTVSSHHVVAGHARVRVEVADTGIGIPPEVVPRLFTVFTQADASTTRRYGGTGLGLAVSKNLVSLMGGRIGVASEPGRGATFWFELDAAVSAAPAADVRIFHTSAGLERTRVLLAEDHPINQAIGVAMLQKLGCVVTLVGNGRLALEALERERFDILLTDCQMPVMDGYEATRRIRANPALAGLPIVGVTAHAMSGDLRHCVDVGMDGYLTKPFGLVELAETLGKHVRPRALGAAAPDADAEVHAPTSIARAAG